MLGLLFSGQVCRNSVWKWRTARRRPNFKLFTRKIQSDYAESWRKEFPCILSALYRCIWQHEE